VTRQCGVTRGVSALHNCIEVGKTLSGTTHFERAHVYDLTKLCIYHLLF